MLDWRSFRTDDLAECLAMDRLSMGHELVGPDRALAAWRILTKGPAFIGAIVEADQPVAGSRILGFGCTALVSEAFASGELANPQPGLNARIIAGVSAGTFSVLTREQIARDNTYGGLYAVILYSFLRRRDLSPDEIDQVASVLVRAAMHFHLGYRLRLVLREAVGTENIHHVHWQKAFRTVSSYDEFYERHPANPWSRPRELFAMDADDARSLGASFYHLLFQYREPVLHFRSVEQDLLNAALDGLTDEELAKALRLKLPTVKKRWASILNRVSFVKPELLPESDNGDSGIRGRQRRHHLLAYLREHPEELRPLMNQREKTALQRPPQP